MTLFQSLIRSGVAASAVAAQGLSITVSVDDPRPLWAALRQLEEKQGWQVSYEDPQYAGTDLVDRTARGYSGPGRALVPRGGQLAVSAAGALTPAQFVQLLIDDHTRRNNPGQFEVRSISGTLVVVPVKGSVLDARITLAQKDRSLAELFRELAQVLTQNTHVRVHEPGMLVGPPQRFTFGANNESARTVLLRALQMKAGGKQPIYIWDLLYAANFGYVLNVHTMRVRVGRPDGTSMLTEVSRSDGR